MKKILFSILVLFGLICSGCGANGEKEIIKELETMVNDSKAYHLKGILDMYNNEDTYTYDVDVAYMDGDYFRVSLKNQVSNHEQIILRNNDGVYVLTPSLNKSFKFQSEWPYNSSGIYLLQTIINDIKNDDERVFERAEDGYIFKVKASYENNPNLVSQNIYFDKDLNIKMVEVLDGSDIIQMKMLFDETDLNATYDDKHFSLDSNLTDNITENTIKSITDIVYPMYVPINTSLNTQNVIATENGERVILTFTGDKPFMFVQETIKPTDEVSITPMYGEPLVLAHTIGSLTNNSITWVEGMIEYCVVSDALTQSELVSVALSTSAIPVMK